MKSLLAVFLGSGMGGVMRYMLSKTISTNSAYTFPLHTLVVNFLACFVLGLLLGLEDRLSFNIRLLLIAGFCGGFSTFSAFSGENLFLIQQGQYVQAGTYILSSFIVCIAATFLGAWITG